VSSGELREFVDLLLLRGGAPLDSCEFLFDVRNDVDVPHVNLWIRHASDVEFGGSCSVSPGRMMSGAFIFMRTTCLLSHGTCGG
jgi:hypothetical protein